jgi:hypothetical protein
MPCVLYGDQLGVRPGAMQFPGGPQGPTNVEPAMDQNTGDSGQPCGLTQK